MLTKTDLDLLARCAGQLRGFAHVLYGGHEKERLRRQPEQDAKALEALAAKYREPCD